MWGLLYCAGGGIGGEGRLSRGEHGGVTVGDVPRYRSLSYDGSSR